MTNDVVKQHNLGLNYTWTVSSNSVLTFVGGMLRTREEYTNDALGKTNDALQAGVQGFATAGREKWIGPPNLNFGSGYQGIFYAGWGVPGALYGGVYNGKVDFHHYHGGHTIAAGIEYADVHTYGDHGSGNVRRHIQFQQSVYERRIRGLPARLHLGSSRNAPLAAFGTDSNPYAGLYFNDNWRIRPNLTVDLGLRYEHWFPRHNSRSGQPPGIRRSKGRRRQPR